MTTMLPRKRFRRCGARHLQRTVLLAAALWVGLADARPAPVSSLSGIVTIADGGPFTIIRQSAIYTGSKGVTLLSGDIVETGPGAFLVVGLTGGSLLGIGPATEFYILPRTDVPTLVVLKGWVKTDVRGSTALPALRLTGTRLGIQSQHAVVLMHVDEGHDAIFDEQGSATLLLRDDTATRTDKPTQANQFFVREDREAVTVQQRPAPDFVTKMPVAFRDALPAQVEGQAAKRPAEAKRVRDVAYADIQPWITLPRDWRIGFIQRFRGRLKDPTFFAAMDAHLNQFPEWVPILHPPPPPEEDQLQPGTPGAPGVQRSAGAIQATPK